MLHILLLVHVDRAGVGVQHGGGDDLVSYARYCFHLAQLEVLLCLGDCAAVQHLINLDLRNLKLILLLLFFHLKNFLLLFLYLVLNCVEIHVGSRQNIAVLLDELELGGVIQHHLFDQLQNLDFPQSRLYQAILKIFSRYELLDGQLLLLRLGLVDQVKFVLQAIVNHLAQRRCDDLGVVLVE